MKDDVFDIKIERAFQAKPWYGLISIEEAIKDAKAYRRSLGSEDRRLYDEQIELGRYPTSRHGDGRDHKWETTTARQ